MPRPHGSGFQEGRDVDDERGLVPGLSKGVPPPAPGSVEDHPYTVVAPRHGGPARDGERGRHPGVAQVKLGHGCKYGNPAQPGTDRRVGGLRRHKVPVSGSSTSGTAVSVSAVSVAASQTSPAESTTSSAAAVSVKAAAHVVNDAGPERWESRPVGIRTRHRGTRTRRQSVCWCWAMHSHRPRCRLAHRRSRQGRKRPSWRQRPHYRRPRRW